MKVSTAGGLGLTHGSKKAGLGSKRMTSFWIKTFGGSTVAHAEIKKHQAE